MVYTVMWIALRAFLRTLFAILGGVRVEGRANIPRGGPLIVTPNHLSHADPPLVGAYLPLKAWFPATDELFGIRLLGAVSRYYRAFPIKQDSPDRAALRRMEDLLAHGETLVLFPEGHESPTGALQPLQGGAILVAMRTGAPVLPVGIQGSAEMLPAWSFRLRRAPRPAVVRFGKPIPIEELTGGLTGKAGIARGLENLEAAIRELSGQAGAEAANHRVKSVAGDVGVGAGGAEQPHK